MRNQNEKCPKNQKQTDKTAITEIQSAAFINLIHPIWYWLWFSVNWRYAMVVVIFPSGVGQDSITGFTCLRSMYLSLSAFALTMIDRLFGAWMLLLRLKRNKKRHSHTRWTVKHKISHKSVAYFKFVISLGQCIVNVNRFLFI